MRYETGKAERQVIDFGGEVKIVDVAECHNGLDNLDPAKLAAVAGVVDAGQALQPVTLTSREGGGYWVVDGRHRIATARARGYSWVWALVV